MTAPKKPHIAVRFSGNTHGKQIPNHIVIHDTESHDAAGVRDITGIATYWKNQGDGLGAHFVIDKDGNIGQGASCDQIMYAVSQHNTGAIHIELIGFAKFAPNAWFVRRKQMTALKQLLAYLCVRWEIKPVGPSRTGIIRHSDFHDVPAGMYHSDPGKGFPFSYVLKGTRAVIAEARK